MTKHRLLIASLVATAFALGYGAVSWAYIVTGPSRNAYYGYFQDQYDAFGTNVLPAVYDGNANAIPNYVNTAAEFIAFIESNLSAGSGNQKGVGAAFIIDTMEGGGTNPPSAATISQWEHDVYYYESQGWVNWNVSLSYNINTYYQGTGTGNNYNDDAFYSDSGTASTILFGHGGVVQAMIRRQCANPVMNNNLPHIEHYPGWVAQGSMLVNNVTTGGAAGTAITALPNEQVHWNGTLTNNGPALTTPYVIWYAILTDTGATVQGGQPSGTYTAGQTKSLYDEWYTIPPGATPGTRVCREILWDNKDSSGGRNGTSTPACVTVVSPATLSCGGATVTPSTGLDPATGYSVAAVVKVAEGQAAAQTVHDSNSFYVNITGPSSYSNPNPAVASTVATSGTFGTLTTALALPATGNGGTYTIDYGLTGPSNISCPPVTFVVASIPYVSVQGGDVAAGPGFGTACIPKLSGILGNNLGAGSGYYGAGTQLAALSLGNISGFATNTFLSSLAGTGSSSSGASALQPSGLAFSNNGTSPTVLGTTFGKDAVDDPADNPTWCVPDYYGSAASATPAPTPLGTNTLTQAVLNGLTSGTTYSVSGTLKIPVALTFGGAGTPARITLVVNGDVVIIGKITYNAYNYVSGTTDIGSIPQFQVLAKGNIYIAKNISQITGFYHAQQSGAAGGTIYTCSNNSAAFLTDDASDSSPNALYDANYVADCGNTLSVYGSLAANHITFNRTGGSLKKTASVANTPAEQIIYTPELWMGSMSNVANGTQQPYDAITNLPPIL